MLLSLPVERAVPPGASLLTLPAAVAVLRDLWSPLRAARSLRSLLQALWLSYGEACHEYAAASFGPGSGYGYGIGTGTWAGTWAGAGTNGTTTRSLYGTALAWDQVRCGHTGRSIFPRLMSWLGYYLVDSIVTRNATQIYVYIALPWSHCNPCSIWTTYMRSSVGALRPPAHYNQFGASGLGSHWWGSMGRRL